MASFSDAEGREWRLRRITIGDYDDLAALGLDVEAVSEDFRKLSALAARPRAFAAVLWWFVGDAVTAAGLAPQQFRAALDGDALYRAARAVTDAIVESFPIPPAAKARLLNRLAEETAKAEADLVTRIERGDGFGPPSGNSPPSPASIPGP